MEMGRNCESGLVDWKYLKRFLSNILCIKYVKFFIVPSVLYCLMQVVFEWLCVYNSVQSGDNLNGFIRCLFTTNSSTIGSIAVQPIVWELQVSSLVINKL